ncbi:MAG: hypothetical protein GY699_19890 [Desulfobacteraceae bacterium]|nr:hypothetical protein [Desulfobacteraceae bacterium]
MKDYIQALAAFVVLLPIIFLSALVYQNDIKVLKKVVVFNFKELRKMDLWMSFFVSLLISTILAYSLL